MAFAHLRHLRPLLRPQVSLLAGLLLAFQLVAQAQDQRQTMGKNVVRENYVRYDQRRIRFGFYIAPNLARFKVQHSQAYVRQVASLKRTDSLQLNSYYSTNFGLGFISNIKLNQYLDVRVLPGVAFYRRGIDLQGDSLVNLNKPLGYQIKDGHERRVVESAMIELPILLKIKSKRRRNVRMYFVGGIKPSMDVTAKKETNSGETEKFRGRPNDVCIEYGVGADLYYPFFKFGPELRFSHGLPNMLRDDNSVFNQAINRATTHTITLLFQFE